MMRLPVTLRPQGPTDREAQSPTSTLKPTCQEVSGNQVPPKDEAECNDQVHTRGAREVLNLMMMKTKMTMIYGQEEEMALADGGDVCTRRRLSELYRGKREASATT